MKPGQTVVGTRRFEASGKGRMTAAEVDVLTERLSHDPEAGDVMKGTGGMRKLRFGTGGRGKSGGMRVVYYYYNTSVPVFRLRVYAKNEKTNLDPGLNVTLCEAWAGR